MSGGDGFLTSWFHGFANTAYCWWWGGLVEDGDAGWVGEVWWCG
jgi:hypothetical protein